jgi:hypothetical protein
LLRNARHRAHNGGASGSAQQGQQKGATMTSDEGSGIHGLPFPEREIFKRL